MSKLPNETVRMMCSDNDTCCYFETDAAPTCMLKLGLNVSQWLLERLIPSCHHSTACTCMSALQSDNSDRSSTPSSPLQSSRLTPKRPLLPALDLAGSARKGGPPNLPTPLSSFHRHASFHTKRSLFAITQAGLCHLAYLHLHNHSSLLCFAIRFVVD